eukprot:CAMPEP_0174291082 /NCGR_PEP_ID=MMETSP0809-20121228/30973_1 /TAXON_ID=73025 ORGANISM="Eutreptiella gymnastica-like, Strain CCMP1594" /NCGR_SAMPLE_ID=MMETSP0809 /ASSEMBLY_ACC=CAM_ASM_000658 /LENGTH=63 /DNA_ID=CAMNT_0015390209 /DNA_START=1136 /DNA_END=1327 /DNA_ORIENTATION=-
MSSLSLYLCGQPLCRQKRQYQIVVPIGEQLLKEQHMYFQNEPDGKLFLRPKLYMLSTPRHINP